MKEFCPKCGAFKEESPVWFSPYSVVCPSCRKAIPNDEFQTSTDLEGRLEPPAGCRVTFTSEPDGTEMLLVPSIGVTGVHYAPAIYFGLWTVVAVCAVISAYGLGILFFIPALFVCIPPLTVVVGAVNSLLETQEATLTEDALVVRKKGFLPGGDRSIPLADVNLISIHGAAPLNPLNPGRYLFHVPETTSQVGQIPVPTVHHKGKQTSLGEFLSDAEKRWLVWMLKAAVLKRTGTSV